MKYQQRTFLRATDSPLPRELVTLQWRCALTQWWRHHALHLALSTRPKGPQRSYQEFAKWQFRVRNLQRTALPPFSINLTWFWRVARGADNCGHRMKFAQRYNFSNYNFSNHDKHASHSQPKDSLEMGWRGRWEEGWGPNNKVCTLNTRYKISPRPFPLHSESRHFF